MGGNFSQEDIEISNLARISGRRVVFNCSFVNCDGISEYPSELSELGLEITEHLEEKFSPPIKVLFDVKIDEAALNRTICEFFSGVGITEIENPDVFNEYLKIKNRSGLENRLLIFNEGKVEGVVFKKALTEILVSKYGEPITVKIR